MISELRPKAIYPVYPTYHKGPYLEEYFYQEYQKLEQKPKRQYIDVFWTNIYCNRDYVRNDNLVIQSELNKLDQNGSYFTVVQHDLSVREKLPKDTLVFDAGGLARGDNIIPIPLICSPIDRVRVENDRMFFGTFVGSMTSPIREKLYDSIKNDEKYVFLMKEWSNFVPMDQVSMFISVTNRSKFSFAPRGFGTTSFRLYEILQLNSVPVYVSDYHHLPWKDEIDWNEFCVIVKESDLYRINEILMEIDDAKYERMLSKGYEIWKKYFSMKGMFDNIIKRLA